MIHKDLLTKILPYIELDYDDAKSIFFKTNYKWQQCVRKLWAPLDMEDAELKLFINLKELYCTPKLNLDNNIIKMKSGNHPTKYSDLETIYSNMYYISYMETIFNDMESLDANNILLTDEGIKKLPLILLECGKNSNFTDNGIKDLQLKSLYYKNNIISDDVIKNIYKVISITQTDYTLYVEGNIIDHITDRQLKRCMSFHL